MANFEKIKNMTIEEMAEIFCVIDFDVNEKCSKTIAQLVPKNG